MPYLRNITGQNVQVVDDHTFAQHMLYKMQHNAHYRALDYVTKHNYDSSSQFSERIDHTQALHLREDGALYVGNQRRALAGVGKSSTTQYSELLADLLENEGIIRYQDAYSYAKAAIHDLSKAYTDLFSARFQYVFIDEYQDCTAIQRQALTSIFDSTKCAVFKIGDSDQAIYNSSEDTTPDWIPQEDFLPIMTSCRFSREIANEICKLKRKGDDIITLAGKTGIKPIILVFSPEKIDRVIGGFISALEGHNLYDSNGVYKAIGAIRKEDSAGLKIGSYWSEFDGASKKNSDYDYWSFVDEISRSLSDGKLYKTEQILRKLLCRVFHYIKIKHPISDKDYTTATIKKALDENYRELYRQWILEMSILQSNDRQSIDHVLRQRINGQCLYNGVK